MKHLPLFFCLLTSTCLAESNWPQFRGEGGLGLGTGKPPLEFGADKNLKWQVEVPFGHSSPCLWQDKIALTGLDGGKLVTICLSRKDGHELWRAAAPAEKVEGAHRIGSPATPTCCTDGERLITYFGSYGVLAYDWNGKVLWQKPLPAPIVEFGTSASPILADGKVIIVADQDVGSYMIALDVKTGEPVWRVDRSEFRRSFSTPFVWRHDGIEELIVSGSLRTRSYDLKDGKLRWSASGMARVSNTSPIAVGDVLIVCGWNAGGDPDDRVEMEPHEAFLAAHDADKNGLLSEKEFPEGPLRDRFTIIDADKNGTVNQAEYDAMRDIFAKAANQLFAIKAGGSGDITDTHVIWRQTKQLPYVFSPVIANGRVFTVKGGGLASAYDAKSGSPIFQAERLDASGEYYASAVTADGRVYVTSQRGVISVLDASSDTLKVLAKNDLKAPVFASPAIVDGVIYVRTNKHLCAFAEPVKDAAAPASRLKGVVRSADGKPLVAATVLIDAAYVKKGYSPLCPGCYADCAKKAVSDYEGKFFIENLNPDLRFDVLVLAPGYKPQMLEKVDPAHVELLPVLSALAPETLPPGHTITGVVLDDHGAPLADAIITPSNYETAAWNGFKPGVFDPLAITDAHGRFTIAATSKIVRADLKVQARGFAPEFMKACVPGKPDQTIRLGRGVTVKGRILLNGKPVPGAAVGLVQLNRHKDNFLGAETVGADSEGAFTIFNVHGGEDYVVYGIMDTLKQTGAVPEMRITPGKAGSTLDVGTLTVVPAHTLRGRVVLSDGGTIQPKQMVLLCRDRAWDHQEIEIDPSGSFSFHGLPSGESFEVCIRLHGYIMSDKNLSLDRYNDYQLTGRVDSDISDLNILMEEAAETESHKPRFDFQKLAESGWNQSQAKQAPLRGFK